MKFRLPFDTDFLMELDIHVYWKDKKGFYLGCNDFMAKNLGLIKPSHIIGLQDHQTIIDHPTAENYQKQDQQILLSNQPNIFLDSGEYHRGQLVFITIKHPIYDQKNIPQGVLGISIPVYEPNLYKVVLYLNKTLGEFTHIKPPEQFLSTYRHTHFLSKLSKREKECLFYLIRGFSVRMIAEKLGLSKRTAEDYIENAKNKLGCSCKSELIELALQCYGLGELLYIP